MSFDLMLEPCCSACGLTWDLYGSSCRHMTLCLPCGKSMAQNHTKCFACRLPITRLIQEYNVRVSGGSDKSYYIGRFSTGLPDFLRKNIENEWSLHREGFLGRHITGTLREKFKNKPWLLEDETGQYQYQGQLEGSQSANYYFLKKQGNELVAIPAGYWYNFNKVAQYKQLTLEEAEEKIKNRRKSAEGYQRWMMKVANNGPGAFGEVDKIDGGRGGAEGGRCRKGNVDNDEDIVLSDRGEEDVEEELARKNRLGLNKKGDDDEGPRGGDLDFDEDDIERDDEDDGEEVEGKLSSSGRELKKLLGQVGGQKDDGEEDDDNNNDEDRGHDHNEMDDDASLVLAPKQKIAPEEEPVESIRFKAVPAGSIRGTPSQAKSSIAKRKLGVDDIESANGAGTKKMNFETDSKPSIVKEEPPSTPITVPPKGLASASRIGSTSCAAPVTEDEIRAVMLQMGSITTQELVAKFKARLKSSEDKIAFTVILKRISKIQHKTSGINYIVLKER